jgi:hypothetical protein
MLILECSQGCYAVKIWPCDPDLWPWKSIGFQILLRPKYVPSLVKIHWRMLILECSQGCDGRKDGSVTISLHNFVGEGIKNASNMSILEEKYQLCISSKYAKFREFNTFSIKNIPNNFLVCSSLILFDMLQIWTSNLYAIYLISHSSTNYSLNPNPVIQQFFQH